MLKEESWMRIVMKIVLYAVIVFVATMITGVVRLKNVASNNAEAGEYCANFRTYSKVFYILGIIMTAIMLFVSLFPGNISVPTQVIIILTLTVPFYLAGYLAGRCYIKLGTTEIKYRRCLGKEKIVRYEDITKAVINDSYAIELYQNDKKILDYPKEFDTSVLKDILKNNKIKVGYLNSIKAFVMEPMKINYICMNICSGIGVLFLGFSLAVNHLGGVLFGACLTICSFAISICYKKDKLIVSDNTITRTKFLKEPRTIIFSDVKSVKVVYGESKKILIYSDVEKVIKIPGHFKNFELFEELIRKQHWKMRDDH